ncbi:hypothetical protein JHW43_001925 [Diplocarpon mali]|nr:hypothetical protein JHW43_001925 [Diplocarpon mali]
MSTAVPIDSGGKVMSVLEQLHRAVLTVHRISMRPADLVLALQQQWDESRARKTQTQVPVTVNQPEYKQGRSTTQGVPMSVFNQQLLEEVDPGSRAKDRFSASYGARPSESRHSQRSHHRAVSKSVQTGNHEPPNMGRAPKSRRSINEQQSSRRPPTSTATSYIRPVGPELVSIRQPSCTGLPAGWAATHDRFIAYLATHAPLDNNGEIQGKEESRERWGSEDIAILVMDRFGELDGPIKTSMIENRLALLDQAGDNDYFKMPYGAYKYERWGSGV